MLVTQHDVADVIQILSHYPELCIDVESTGLRPYHGDRIFAIAIASPSESYYFDATSITPDLLHFLKTAPITWYGHNIRFDMHMLYQEGVELLGSVHCTQAIERVIRPQELKYDLATCAERIGLKKDVSVEEYIEENQLWDWEEIPGKKQRKKRKHFDRVPREIIAEYAQQDAIVCFNIAQHQKKTLSEIDSQFPKAPSLLKVYENECRLMKTVFRMEKVGVQIDKDYCERASAYERARGEKALKALKAETGREFVNSGKFLSNIFSDEKDRWVRTEKGNFSFDSSVLKTFKSPLAKMVLDYRDAKSKADFYYGFIYHADRDGVIHPNFKPDGTKTGRFSSSEPNFQNLTSEEDDEELNQEFVVRRALIPRPGYILIMPDYSMMEYRLLFEYAYRGLNGITDFGRKIAGGEDVHQATADAITQAGFPLKRSQAKNANFAILYGAGYQRLAETAGCSLSEAKNLKQAVFRNAPEMAHFIQSVLETIQNRGVIWNWLGRRYYRHDSNYDYTFPNKLIQGGCADVIKVAMNQIDEYLLDKKSRMVMSVHDEIVLECHGSELSTVPKRINEIMESVFPASYIPLTASMEWSGKSLADKVKGFPE